MVPFLPFFCSGSQSIMFCLFTPQMVLKLVQKQKRDIDLKILVTRLLPRMRFLANFSKFHKMVPFETGKGFFKTKNRVGKENGLFYQLFIKNGKKGKRGTIYLDFFENLIFEIFGRFLTKIQIYPFWYGTLFALFFLGIKSIVFGFSPL